MVIGLKVESENIQSGEKKHCNSSYFTMVAKDKEGKSVPVPGIILDSVDSIRRYARSIRRQEQSKIRTGNFDRSKFKVDEYIELVDGHNAKIEMIWWLFSR